MAIFRSKNSLSSLLPIFLTFFFFFFNKVNSTKSLSFSYTYFVDGQPDLIFQRDAFVNPENYLQLNNKTAASMGRVLYATPFQIWDNKTGNVASFTTSFSFFIQETTVNALADGFTFFLAPVDTLPAGIGTCGLLGLFNNESSSPSNQVVAVEFDTYNNIDYDPVDQPEHIGIDVNSIKSHKTIPWTFDSGTADVTISYDGSTKVLTATLVYGFGAQESYIISSVVNMQNILPEYVRFGFSASNGCDSSFDNAAQVEFWSFESTLPLDS